MCPNYCSRKDVEFRFLFGAEYLQLEIKYSKPEVFNNNSLLMLPKIFRLFWEKAQVVKEFLFGET